ncbi:hypothetical protein BJ684DRAFT_21185 [Piptocephalis cylindrospora]|uniref:Uncharacterized protein n=1 Tax=Piptocephalis cylindrospora TaxID=1907219 RepID=A0A4P9Y178_9FUNG|nr:hypothetical protein BJ684DRAFT_21185 [Piptocephalis cylindrospora]|eukprot:RKP12262.1 hypothetical protein BJ684DRAFT_21185 [Piptocephalis cylindrospora]
MPRSSSRISTRRSKADTSAAQDASSAPGTVTSSPPPSGSVVSSTATNAPAKSPAAAGDEDMSFFEKIVQAKADREAKGKEASKKGSRTSPTPSASVALSNSTDNASTDASVRPAFLRSRLPDPRIAAANADSDSSSDNDRQPIHSSSSICMAPPTVEKTLPVATIDPYHGWPFDSGADSEHTPPTPVSQDSPATTKRAKRTKATSEAERRQRIRESARKSQAKSRKGLAAEGPDKDDDTIIQHKRSVMRSNFRYAAKIPAAAMQMTARYFWEARGKMDCRGQMVEESSLQGQALKDARRKNEAIKHAWCDAEWDRIRYGGLSGEFSQERKKEIDATIEEHIQVLVDEKMEASAPKFRARMAQARQKAGCPNRCGTCRIHTNGKLDGPCTGSPGPSSSSRPKGSSGRKRKPTTRYSGDGHASDGAEDTEEATPTSPDEEPTVSDTNFLEEDTEALVDEDASYDDDASPPSPQPSKPPAVDYSTLPPTDQEESDLA